MAQPYGGNSLFGVQWPWHPAGPDQAVDYDLIDSLLRDLIFTSPGEYMMLPTFGSRVREAVFENMGEPLRILVDLSVRNAVAQWMPVIQIVSVDVEDTGETSALVTVNYRYQGIESSTSIPV